MLLGYLDVAGGDHAPVILGPVGIQVKQMLVGRSAGKIGEVFIECDLEVTSI